jgi:hypothetical protein
MKTKLMWLPAVALGLALVGQGALYRAEDPVLTMTASWKHRPASVDEARDLATSVVQAEVVSVKADADLVVPAAGEPTGEDRIPTQRVQVRVTKAHKGQVRPGQTVELFQVGGKLLPTTPPDGKNGARVEAKQLILEGDPPYKPGEQYLLMLEDGPRGLQRPVAPEGRFRIERGGVLTAMVDNDATKPIQGRALPELERTFEKGQ